jgi:3'-phosphoadenosine 5'-phosphosulfate sulfotransferase (PAPS reductase)/FAD synthetase
MKKEPSKRYSKETGRKPITATMASESRLRTQKWLQNGCNGFEMKSPISNPMSFWTEQDVLLYIKQNNLPICGVYGEIVEDLDGTDEVEGQLTMSDIEGWENQGIFDAERLPLKTTGCNRTGCMFCGFGCHLEKESRFERMKQTHPKQYDYIMRPAEEGGLNYKEVIDWINEHGNLNIRY